MPVVCDFTMIQGDGPVTIGDHSNPNGWTQRFNTGGRYDGGAAFLIFNVQNLTATRLSVQVEVNDQEVGRIFSYYPAGAFEERNKNAAHWYTQMINIGPRILNNGDNILKVSTVEWENGGGTDQLDDFKLKDVVCFFQQHA
ncbi:MAG: hypothetical protein F6K16_39855 [Symploca sp. SIO2B6]|nr:hypothetical protein [Symploca sp. SIO2B6]